MSGGSLRIYLGAAPGVGKTFAMLGEGRRRADRGTDVVIGFIETHGRAHTAELAAGLELVPRRLVTADGATSEEMDVDAVLDRRPAVALVDEIAHTNAPGSRNAYRWQDVRALLDAGIDVISTVNIEHVESVSDVARRITGIEQRETVPDFVVRDAAQVELVDMTPEALRRRLAHGNVFTAERIDAALANYFRVGNLTALRELALLWVADQADEALDDYRHRHGITDAWDTRERIVVAVTGALSTEHLIRRAARIAWRSHGELVGVHVRSDRERASPDTLERHRTLLEEVGGRFVEIAGADVAAALVTAARLENATQLVLGASRRGRWQRMTRGSVINRVVRLSGPIDVHVISQEAAGNDSASGGSEPSRQLRRASALPPRRRQLGWALGALGVPVLTAVLIELRDELGLPPVLLLYLLLAVGVATLGGAAPALLTAVAGFLCSNWFFTPPTHTWSVGEFGNVVALVVFLAVAGIVSALVAIVAKRAAEVTRAGAEAETLARIAGALPAVDPLPQLVDHLRVAFALDGVALLARTGDGWQVVGSAGGSAPSTPESADLTMPVSDRLVLAFTGGRLSGDDRRVLGAFTASLTAAEERRRLGAEAARAAALAEANELRGALLQAVSHDLRTPLASIKASVSSLRQSDIEWSDTDRDSFLATVEEETNRLTSLVANLLDMSRISAGVLRPTLRAVTLEEVVPAAVLAVGPDADRIEVDVSEALPPVRADPALLERVVANLVQNAVSHGDGKPIAVTAAVIGQRMHLRIVDRGPGIPATELARIFEPFQRLYDRGAGIGLGLAVANGFVRLMDGDLVVEETPGGGTTMVIELAVMA